MTGRCLRLGDVWSRACSAAALVGMASFPYMAHAVEIRRWAHVDGQPTIPSGTYGSLDQIIVDGTQLNADSAARIIGMTGETIVFAPNVTIAGNLVAESDALQMIDGNHGPDSIRVAIFDPNSGERVQAILTDFSAAQFIKIQLGPVGVKATIDGLKRFGSWQWALATGAAQVTADTDGNVGISLSFTRLYGGSVSVKTHYRNILEQIRSPEGFLNFVGQLEITGAINFGPKIEFNGLGLGASFGYQFSGTVRDILGLGRDFFGGWGTLRIGNEIFRF